MNSVLRPALLVCVMLSALDALGLQETTPPTQRQVPEGASVAIVLDTSSPAQKKFPELKEAVSTFLSSFGEDDEVCLYVAGGKPQLIEEFTGDASLLNDRLQALKPAGPLALSEAISAAQQHIREESASDRVAVVVFVAGPEAAAPVKTVEAKAEADGGSSAVPIHVITAPGADWRAQETLQRLSSDTGGIAYFPASGEQLREIAAETGNRLAGDNNTSAAAGAAGRTLIDPKRPLATYEQLIVRAIPVAETKETEEFPGGDNAVIHRLLLSRLQKSNVFHEVFDGSTAAPPTAPQPNAVSNGRAELLATLVKYRRGNRLQRQFVGWKGGALFRLQVQVVDAATRQPLMSFTKEASSAVGPFGGSQELVQTKALINVVNQIVKEMSRAKRD
jgi:hypothetical protein